MINSMMATPSPVINNGNDIMSKSLIVNHVANSPKTPQPIPKMQSNFKRTSSLRISNRKPKPAVYTPPVKSNIHCGIDTDGPISPNFVKATDYDELPIKSPYSAIKMSEMNRMQNQVPSRATPSPTMPMINNPLISQLRDKDSALIRKNLKLDLKNPNLPSTDYSLSKTDSMALFLKYEKEMTAKMSEKEMKDKTNIISKRSLSQAGSSNKLPDINGKQMPQQKQKIVTSNSDDRSMISIDNLNKTAPDDNTSKSHSAPVKMMNACDNLPSLLLNGSGSDKSRSPSIDRKTSPEESPNQNSRRSGNSTLRRRQKFNMDNILFDTDPEVTTTPGSSDNSNNNSLNRPDSRISNTESIFEDFDFDQFIASFNDDDKFPIFKDYKMMMNKSPKPDVENNNGKQPLNGVVKNLTDTKPIAIQPQQRSEAELSGLEKLDNLCKMLSGNSDSDESNSLETDPTRSKSSADSAYGR